MKIIIFLVIYLLFYTTLQFAQNISGNLEGKIIDSIGVPIADVNILLQGENLQGTKGTSTNERGNFSIFLLPIGNYDVKISAVGYRDLNIKDVQISLGKTTNVGEIKLEQQAIDLPEVTISAEKQLIDLTSTNYGGNIESKEFEQLPIDRDYKSIATLFPLANTSYYGDGINLGNGTGSENRYFIDGVDVTDPTFGMEGTTLPYNFVKEVELITGGYEAEYRSALGGLINVVTPSGSNELHGSVFGFYTSNGLSAPAKVGYLDPTQGAFSNYDFGFNLNGPIVKDELWFNIAYNPIFNKRDVDVPSFGIFVDKSITHSFAGKLTWKATDKLNLSLSLSGDPNKRDAIGDQPSGIRGGPPVNLENIDPYLSEQEGGGINISLDGNYLINNNIFLEAQLSGIFRRQIWIPATERGKNEMVLVNTEIGTWSGGYFGNLSISRSATTAVVILNYHTGMHRLKFGAEYRDNKVEIDLYGPNVLYRHNDSLYVLTLNGTYGTVHNRIPSVFLQDDWQITSKFRINAGLRWDGQFIIGGDGRVAQKILEPLQPRIGIVFLPDDDGTQKFYGSFGRFIQEWHTASMTGAYTGTGYYYEILFNEDPSSGSIPGDTVINTPGAIEPEEQGLQAQYYDDWILGYERMIDKNFKISIQGIYRILQEAIAAGFVQGGFRESNPGKGILSEFPEATREFTALVLTLEKTGGENFNFLTSYSLSRNYGNYEGLYDSYNKNIVPNVNFTFAEATFLENATGLLPNDRTHVFKFSCSYRFDFGLILGSTFYWMTGTPLSDIAWFGSFIQQRGTAGRTSPIWDLSVRVIYPIVFYSGLEVKLILDAFHIASQREPVNIDQQHYFNVDVNGDPINLNPNYGVPTRYQSPMSFRLGLEINF